jgi:hypothetical protein
VAERLTEDVDSLIATAEVIADPELRADLRQADLEPDDDAREPRSISPDAGESQRPGFGSSIAFSRAGTSSSSTRSGGELTERTRGAVPDHIENAVSHTLNRMFSTSPSATT